MGWNFTDSKEAWLLKKNNEKLNVFVKNCFDTLMRTLTKLIFALIEYVIFKFNVFVRLVWFFDYVEF